MDTSFAYLKVGDWVTISHDNLFLSIQSLTQSGVVMRDTLSNPINSVFILATPKYIEMGLNFQKQDQKLSQDQVYFGESLILIHLISGKFLSYSHELDNKSSMELVSTFKTNCQFAIKPIFKCQTVVSRKIRNQEDIIICPAQLKNRQGNMALVLLKADRSQNKSYVCMKKNEQTNFKFSRKNLQLRRQKSVTNLQVYQLTNVETKKILHMESNSKHSDKIGFEKKINQYGSYFDLRVADTQFQSLKNVQCFIKYGVPVFFHSWKEDKYLNIDLIGDICLTENATEDGLFCIEPYNYEELSDGSIVRVKHMKSEKYISLEVQQNKIQMISQARLIDTYFLNKVPNDDLKLTIFINDAHKILIRQLSGEKLSYRNKKYILKILRELVFYIYGEFYNVADFLSMKKTIHTKLSILEQKLLADVGIIHTLVSLCKIVVHEYEQENQKNMTYQKKDDSEEHNIMLNVMMCITGICLTNPLNTRILTRQLPFLYESIDKLPGIIELLFHLFKDSKQLLLILENTSHQFGKKQILSIDLLMNSLQLINFDIGYRTKILTLMEVLIIVKRKQKILGHQISILRALKNSKLNNIILKSTSNDHNDLLIMSFEKETFEELEQMLITKRRYEKQLQLLKIQLSFICSLCYGRNLDNVQFMRSVVPEQMIYRYLKGNLQPQFKEIFMRILIDIYLHALDIQNNKVSSYIIITDLEELKKQKMYHGDQSSLTSRLISQDEKSIQMAQIDYSHQKHSKIIEKIQNLVLENTRKAIANEIIDCSFYMFIKALRKFFSLQILDHDEILQFKTLLTEYIFKYHKQSFLEQEKKNIVLEILKIITQYADKQIEDVSHLFITSIKNSKDINQKNLVNYFIEFTRKIKFFNSEAMMEDLKFIPILVNESLKHSDADIFIGVSQLFKSIKKRKSNLICRLRNKIILDSSQSVSLYKRITKLNLSLKSEIHELLTIQMDPKEAASREQKLNNLITQINFLFFESNSKKLDLFALAQNIYRELNVFETISWFINDNQRRIKESAKNKHDIFSTCFLFISYYLKDNEQNFYRFRSKYLDIKYVFENTDRGQIKFLNQLIKMPVARKLMLDQILQCVLLSFKCSNDPNPYSLLSLINCLSYGNIEKDRIQKFVSNWLKNQQLICQIFKISQKGKPEFFWSYDVHNKNYHKNWLLYSMLMIKFCLLLIENSSERASIAIEIQKYLTLSNIILLLKCPDLTSGMSTDNLCSTILKKQLIKLFQRIYMNDLHKEESQIQNIFSFLQGTFQNITYMKEDLIGAKDHLLDDILNNKSDELGIINQVQIQSNPFSAKIEFEKYLNPMYMNLVVYYPFIIKVLDTLLSSNSYIQRIDHIKKEGQNLMQFIYRKFKDYVQGKLKYGEYSKTSKQYKNAITLCEEIFKRKIGFNLILEDEEQEYNVKEQVEVEQVIILNRKLENTNKCFLCHSNDSQKRLYSCFLQLFHSDNLRQHLLEQQNQVVIEFENGEFEKLMKIITNLLSTRPQQLQSCLQFFLIYLSGNIKQTNGLNVNSARQYVTYILQKQKNDLQQKNLCLYLQISTQILQNEIDWDERDRNEKKQREHNFKQEFINRINKFLEAEKKMYLGNKFNEQLNVYSEYRLLSFETHYINLNVETCLVWIRNFLALVPTKSKIKYSMFFLEVVELLQTYTDFIKQFNFKYLSRQLQTKINLCLEIIFHSTSGIKSKNPYTNYLIESQIWNDFNVLLSLDDGWSRNLDQLNDNRQNTLSKSIRNQLRLNSRTYLSQISLYYKGSKHKYGSLIPDQYYPLLPIKGFFAEVKGNVIGILKQFKHFSADVSQQLFTRLDMRIVDRNIAQIYIKHENMFTKYGIPSVETQIDYNRQEEWKEIAENISLQNGVDLTAIKMFIDDHYGSGQIKTEYYNQRLEATSSKKIQSAFTTILNFIRDFFLLFISCFLLLCRKKRKNKETEEIKEGKMQHIINFFLQKMGRVEIQMGNSLYNVEFMIRPQCTVNKYMNDHFINHINFVSIQLKLESIMNQANEFILYYENQIYFYQTFNKISIITFLTKNFEMINYVNFVVIVAQNIILIANSHSADDYFVDTNPDQPFVWLQIVSTSTAGLILFAYLIKDFPLLLKNINLKLKRRAQSYGSNYNNYNFLVKFGIKLSMVILNPTFAYHILYSVVVGLVFYNKLFVALLLLDIFFQIPLLKNLLMSIWRPKIQLILAIVSFILVQYFFSIFMFFNFKTETQGFCDTLSTCFGFVFVTTYKAVGGFVGYLFEKSNGQINSVNFFEIFQDAYVILVYQIFFALILAIIIDTFSLIRSEQTVRKQYLNGCCIVCNQDKSRFNSTNITFRAHIAINHNIWNYFYYYEYVNRKKSMKYAPYERYIYLSSNSNWLPTNRSKDNMDVEVSQKMAIE